MKAHAGMFLFLSLILGSSTVLANDCSVEVWARKPGQYVDHQTYQKLELKKVNLSKLDLIEKKGWDGQYDAEQTYKGVPLRHISQEVSAAKNHDEILLHFDNGMIVPQDSLPVFVAVQIKDKKVWTNDFPEIKKAHYRYKDPRPIHFNCNKVVIDKKLGKKFSPWHHTTSLVGIEYVNKQAYENQFLPQSASATVKAGHEVFLQRCQYCHGIKNVGATFGWDYYDPLKIYEKRDKQSLRYHIQSEPFDKVERGLMMPAQPRASEQDVDALWEWMKAASLGKLQAYQP